MEGRKLRTHVFKGKHEESKLEVARLFNLNAHRRDALPPEKLNLLNLHK